MKKLKRGLSPMLRPCSDGEGKRKGLDARVPPMRA